MKLDSELPINPFYFRGVPPVVKRQNLRAMDRAVTFQRLAQKVPDESLDDLLAAIDRIRDEAYR